MPHQLVCRPEQDLPVAVLRVCGVLDRVTGDALGSAVRGLLAAQPDALLRLRLRPVPDACRQARQLVVQACTAWQPGTTAQLGGLVSAGAIIASELVANVVRHARTGMEFTIGLQAGSIVLAVRDGSTRLPRPAEPGPSVVGGRGLRLVHELADSWGVLPVSGGKVVWSTLSTPASPGAP